MTQLNRHWQSISLTHDELSKIERSAGEFIESPRDKSRDDSNEFFEKSIEYEIPLLHLISRLVRHGATKYLLDQPDEALKDILTKAKDHQQDAVSRIDREALKLLFTELIDQSLPSAEQIIEAEVIDNIEDCLSEEGEDSPDECE